MEDNEIRAVLAHELGHIQNYDVPIATVAAVVAGAVSSVARIAMWSYAPSGSNRRRGSIFGDILILILSPILALIIQLAISRSREYAADATSAKVTHHPEDLISALMKIDSGVKSFPMNTNPALSSLYIQNPHKGNFIFELFSTHPSTSKRIAKLEAIEKQ